MRSVLRASVLAVAMRLLVLRTSERAASDYTDFGLRSASRVVVVAVSVRLLVLRTSQRFASPPTSRSVDPVGLVDGSVNLGYIFFVVDFLLRGACATRSSRCARRDVRRGRCRTAWTGSSRIHPLRVTQ